MVGITDQHLIGGMGGVTPLDQSGFMLLPEPDVLCLRPSTRTSSIVVNNVYPQHPRKTPYFFVSHCELGGSDLAEIFGIGCASTSRFLPHTASHPRGHE